MFLYFDLGNVVLHFDHERACRQMADVAGAAGKPVTPQQVRQVVFESGLEWEYEAGQVSTAEFYEQFCQATGTRPDLDAMAFAASDIFWTNRSLRPVLAALAHGRHRLGLLSNTNEIHWRFVCDQFPFVPATFETVALSYEIGAAKPDPPIFAEAARLAGAAPAEIFFVDDRPDNVEGARQASFDAVVYESTPQLVSELRTRGVQLNY